VVDTHKQQRLTLVQRCRHHQPACAPGQMPTCHLARRSAQSPPRPIRHVAADPPTPASPPPPPHTFPCLTPYAVLTRTPAPAHQASSASCTRRWTAERCLVTPAGSPPP
jgi:hypothetical protein